MARKVNMFFDVQLLIIRCLFFILIDVVSANEMITSRIGIVNKPVDLHCSFPVSNQTVSWKLRYEMVDLILSTCEVECTTPHGLGIIALATRSETSSTCYVTQTVQIKQQMYCFLGETLQHTYNVTFIKKPDISPPNCSIIPITSQQGKDATLRFSCESNVTSELPYRLNILGLSENISTNGKSELHVEHDVDVEVFIENLNVVCELMISDVNISNCSFPHSTNVTYTRDVTNMVTDAVFDCHADPGDIVTWRLLDSEGREEDMAGRSWTRDGKRSLLIKNITKQDLGKVAECRIDGSVGFGVIDGIGSSEIDGHNGSTGTYGSHDDRSVYVILTFVFGGLLLLTLLIVVSHWRCGACEQPMKWYAQFTPHSKTKTSTTNQLSGSNENNFSEGGSNSRSRGRDVVTIPESNLNSGNQNNSALNHPRDPTPQIKATLSSVADASSSGHPDQPVVDSNQHTYFCVERTTPPPSLPDLSTSGSVTIYQDPDNEESHGERLRDSAGYDVVDASKKMNNNFDMEDYAEVGGAYDMTSNPAIAPRNSKGLTGKGVVMSCDLAVLYGKVNK